MTYRRGSAVATSLLALAALGCEPEGRGAAVPVVEGEPPVAATPAVRAPVGFGEYDADRDQRLSAEEFVRLAGARGAFARWDTDGDGWVDAGEFVPGVRRAWRTEGPDVLEDEWAEAEGWFPEDLVERPVFHDWDLDDDGRIEEDEFGSGAEGSGLFALWDADDDERLTEQELYDSLFRVLDEDDDRFLEADEWRYATQRWDLGIE